MIPKNKARGNKRRKLRSAKAAGDTPQQESLPTGEEPLKVSPVSPATPEPPRTRIVVDDLLELLPCVAPATVHTQTLDRFKTLTEALDATLKTQNLYSLLQTFGRGARRSSPEQTSADVSDPQAIVIILSICLVHAWTLPMLLQRAIDETLAQAREYLLARGELRLPSNTLTRDSNWNRFFDAVIRFGCTISQPSNATFDLLAVTESKTRNPSLFADALARYPSASGPNGDPFGSATMTALLAEVLNAFAQVCASDESSQLLPGLMGTVCPMLFPHESAPQSLDRLILYCQTLSGALAHGAKDPWYRITQAGHQFARHDPPQKRHDAMKSVLRELTMISQEGSTAEYEGELERLAALFAEQWEQFEWMRPDDLCGQTLHQYLSCDFVSIEMLKCAWHIRGWPLLNIDKLHSVVTATAKSLELDIAVPSSAALLEGVLAQSTGVQHTHRLLMPESELLVFAANEEEEDSSLMPLAIDLASETESARRELCDQVNRLIVDVTSQASALQAESLLEMVAAEQPTSWQPKEQLMQLIKQHPFHGALRQLLKLTEQQERQYWEAACGEDGYALLQYGLAVPDELLDISIEAVPPSVEAESTTAAATASSSEAVEEKQEESVSTASQRRSKRIRRILPTLATVSYRFGKSSGSGPDQVAGSGDRIKKVYEAMRTLIADAVRDAQKSVSTKIGAFDTWRFPDRIDNHIGTILRRFQPGQEQIPGMDTFTVDGIRLAVAQLNSVVSVLGDADGDYKPGVHIPWNRKSSSNNVGSTELSRAEAVDPTNEAEKNMCMFVIAYALRIALTYVLILHVEVTENRPPDAKDNANLHALLLYRVRQCKSKESDVYDNDADYRETSFGRSMVYMRAICRQIELVVKMTAVYRQRFVLHSVNTRFGLPVKWSTNAFRQALQIPEGARMVQCLTALTLGLFELVSPSYNALSSSTEVVPPQPLPTASVMTAVFKAQESGDTGQSQPINHALFRYFNTPAAQGSTLTQRVIEFFYGDQNQRQYIYVDHQALVNACSGKISFSAEEATRFQIVNPGHANPVDVAYRIVQWFYEGSQTYARGGLEGLWRATEPYKFVNVGGEVPQYEQNALIDALSNKVEAVIAYYGQYLALRKTDDVVSAEIRRQYQRQLARQLAPLSAPETAPFWGPVLQQYGAGRVGEADARAVWSVMPAMARATFVDTFTQLSLRFGSEVVVKSLMDIGQNPAAAAANLWSGAIQSSDVPNAASIVGGVTGNVLGTMATLLQILRPPSEKDYAFPEHLEPQKLAKLATFETDVMQMLLPSGRGALWTTMELVLKGIFLTRLSQYTFQVARFAVVDIAGAAVPNLVIAALPTPLRLLTPIGSFVIVFLVAVFLWYLLNIATIQFRPSVDAFLKKHFGRDTRQIISALPRPKYPDPIKTALGDTSIPPPVQQRQNP